MELTPKNIRDAVERAATSGKRLELSDDSPGLELGISPRGACAWSLRMRDPSGRLRRFKVGNLDDFSPTAARKAARALRVRVEGGADPIEEKRAERRAGADLRAGIGTLGALFDQYEREGKPPKTWFSGAGRKRVERVFGPLLPQAVMGMKAADVIRVADAYSGSANAAQNAIRALRPVFSWAIRRDFAPAALLALTPGAGVPTRERVLTEHELRRVLPVLRSWPTAHGGAMLFILLTLARRGEAEGVTWSEIDLEGAAWTLPAERQKKTKRQQDRRPLLIPLSRPAVRLLRRLKPKNPAPDSLVFATSKGTKLGNWDREQKRIFEKSGTSGWHRHDLRRTGATLIGDMGAPPHVVEAALNHIVIHNDLASRYNRSRYAPEVEESLEKLGVKLRHLAGRAETRPDEYGEPEEVWVTDL